MVSEYKLNLYPHKDLIIFEMGGDNGRLMPHILDYIKRYEPSVYKRTQYNMIELSDRAVSPSFIRKDALAEHDCVQILNENIFEWDTLVSEQCFFLGMKVIVSIQLVMELLHRLIISSEKPIRIISHMM